ncbi:MAG: 2-amino-4-hydroxy-6-hydroxymethyldihydropteridine diphosphokinase [Flavobacteriales bacterium AspAUS03]
MPFSQVFLMLGSNKGDKKQYLDISLILIAQRMGEIVETSSYYESQPWEMKDAPVFWNRVLRLKTTHSPMDLLKGILGVEWSLGKTSKSSDRFYEDREIDIDILFYNQIVFEGSRLSIPHPLLHLRRFVLKPMCELAPQKQHPIFGLTLNTLLSRCTDLLSVKKID